MAAAYLVLGLILSLSPVLSLVLSLVLGLGLRSERPAQIGEPRASSRTATLPTWAGRPDDSWHAGHMTMRSADGQSTWTEGQDGSVTRYRERLRAPWWMWLISLLFSGSLGIAYGGAYGAAGGWPAFIVAQALLSVGLWASAPVIRVDERVLRAGRARLPLTWIGQVHALDAEQAQRARRQGGDPAAYLLLRVWAAPTAVVVAVTDPVDPHPYWLLTSRHPEALTEAVRAGAQDAVSSAAGTG